MATNRTQATLHPVLVELLGSNHCYFQPSSNITIKYPCIVYDFDNFDQRFADDKRYMLTKKFTVTHIYQHADEELRDKFFQKFTYVEFDRSFKSDGLYHDVYVVHW